MEPVYLDNRGFSPPEPMIRIMRALEQLAESQKLVVQMDREPLLLYRELERRGYGWDFDPGSKLLVVQRSSSPD